MKYLIACLALATACAQPPAQSPVFEVVSIKPSPPGAGSTVSSGGGPGTRDPGLWTCRGPNLANIILWAFQLNSSEYLTAPDWMLDARFDIDARVPAGATREQFSQMLQNMLIERFGLKFHRREKEVQGYELVVARNGPKFKEPSESSPDAAAPGAQLPKPVTPTWGADGYPEFGPGAQGWAMSGNRAGAHWPRITMPNLAVQISRWRGVPVADATGLSGAYDVSLRWVPNPDLPEADGPSIFAALEDQLGLKLNARKATVSTVIVDYAERVPTEN